MANLGTQISTKRLLLNAEPFGFGPTAAIADFFPHLRRMFSTIGYVGGAHTLDLQRVLPYDALHALPPQSSDDELRGVLSQYDILLTALDFAVADQALRCGLQVCVYDPLTWYWKSLPSVLGRCHYMAQDFFGVRERISSTKDGFGSVEVVPLIIGGTVQRNCDARAVLLNFGGLGNPYWSQSEVVAYATLIAESVAEVARNQGLEVVVAANTAIARELGRFGARNFSREKMRDVLAHSKFALMTPGLGNICDATQYSLPTVWLPPANDSQGQQLRALQANGLVDAHIDWSDFVGSDCPDYNDEQASVLREISNLARRALASDRVRARLSAQVEQAVRAMYGRTGGACSELIERFGYGGAARVAASVYRLAQKE